MSAYYNENDPVAAAWLRELIKQGHIAHGEVDERSIADVRPHELAGFTQCHFFAGIGGWSYALRLAGWPDDRPVWTGSCPCQPFSAAGKQRGTYDARHLWPVFFGLIRECRPSVIFGEQVASKSGLGWIDIVSADMEGANYAIGAADLCAAGIGAPHIRQRLWWVANRETRRWREVDAQHRGRDEGGATQGCERPEHGCSNGGEWRSYASSENGRLVDAERTRLEEFSRDGDNEHQPGRQHSGATGSTTEAGRTSHWRDVDWLPCSDGKARPVKPGIEPLADGIPARVGRLRGYGNAIVPQVAAAFIRAAT